MNWDVEELDEQLQQLKCSGSTLSTEMRAAAALLTDSGQCPLQELESSIGVYRNDWIGLCSELEMPPQDTAIEDAWAWDQLDGRLTDIRLAAEALKRLRKVERLRVPAGSESLLDPVHKAFLDAKTRLTQSPWNESKLVQDVWEGRDPLCRLVALVESLHELTDDQWVSEMNATQQVFGVALSTALARGKVTLSTASVTEPTE